MKKIYMQPETTVLEVYAEPLLDWFSTNVNPDEEIEDDDVGAKQGFIDFDEEEEFTWGNVWQ